MGFHTYDPGRADALEDESRYEYLSVDELLALVDADDGDSVLDVGSGTGFYTDDVAAEVEAVYALDLQPEMHALYREKGVPENVSLLTAIADNLPLRDGTLDGVFSTMTYHEFAAAEAFAELARVIRPGGRVVTVDWSKTGAGADGPPMDERFGLADAVEAFEEAGFTTVEASSRRETFVHVASR
jgi:ubiquinone/menaquinone biosynthesis C-methylase UbiE